jgi:hypothetical protein
MSPEELIVIAFDTRYSNRESNITSKPKFKSAGLKSSSSCYFVPLLSIDDHSEPQPQSEDHC